MIRLLQKKGLPWEIAKAFDGSAAVGNFVTLTPEMEIQKMNFQLKLNDEIVQDGKTSDMIFHVDKIIAYVSRFFTLNIGDLVFTGTPSGVGPVNGGDKLEGYLEGNKVLTVEVK